MNILQIHLSRLQGISKETLDGVTAQSNNVGKKEGNYWIIKSDTMINGYPEQAHQEVNLVNHLLNLTRNFGYSDLMLIDR